MNKWGQYEACKELAERVLVDEPYTAKTAERFEARVRALALVIFKACEHHMELVAALQGLLREYSLSLVRGEVYLTENTLRVQKAARAVLAKVDAL